MIDKIAYEIAKSISTTLSFSDKWAGLTKPLRKKVRDRDTVFPVAINTISSCSQSDYTALTPDNTKKSVLYIENTGDVALDISTLSQGKELVTTTLRVVCWYNLDMITQGAYISEDYIVNEVYKNIPKTLPDSMFDNVKSVHISPLRVVYGSDIFSQYTYDEIKTQYGLHPYGYFAIDIEVWYVILTCLDDINPLTGCKTGMGEHLVEIV